jgi:hypothetical protein
MQTDHESADTLQAVSSSPGDRVLRRVAEGIPADAFMVRLGGDEFAVLLPRSTNESPGVLASALPAKLRESADDTEEAITATAGVAPLGIDRRQSLIQGRPPSLPRQGARWRRDRRRLRVGFHLCSFLAAAWKTRKPRDRGAFVGIAGAGFEPATFGL